MILRYVLFAAALSATPVQPPPLFDNLGNHHHPISTNITGVQRYFDQGLRLLYAFNHDEALRDFQEAVRRDPQCLMCLWGVALALGPHINVARDTEKEKLAWETIQRGQALAPRAPAREAAYLSALAKRYAEPPASNPGALDLAYANAMRELSKGDPDDSDAATLFAEAMMDLRPWKLWTLDGKPEPGTEEIVSVLEEVLRKHPTHPGANHYYIHAVEASPHPEKALACAKRLPGLMPGAGHLVHMPSHIYLRVGRYAEASRSNEQAIQVDRAYLKKAKPTGIYPMMYASHNFQFLWATASAEGRSARAIQAAREMAAMFPEEMVGQMEAAMPGVDYYLGPPLLALIRFGRWQDALNYPKPPDSFRYLNALWHYARSLALIRTGELTAAEKEQSQLTSFVQRLAPDAVIGNNSAVAIFAVATKTLEGELAASKGKLDEAVRVLGEAVSLEDRLGYEEPPAWYQPVRLSLGAVLLRAGKPAEAEAVYREDLRRNPGNGWALFGLMKSLDGRSQPAAAAKARFRKAWARADVKLTESRF